MTSSSFVDGVISGASLYRAVKLAADNAALLKDAAGAVAGNLRWMRAHRTSPFVLLDFDVIVGAVPALSRRLQAQYYASEEATSISDLSSKTFGPAELQVALNGIEDYTIPSGAAAELLIGLERLRGRLSARTQKFLTNVRRGSRLVHAQSESSGPVDLQRIVSFDLKAIQEDLDGYALLQNVVDRATAIKPSPKFGLSSSESGDLIKRAYDLLTAARPERSQNNFNDALNATVLANILSARGVEGESGRRFAPVLVSGTRMLSQLSMLPQFRSMALGPTDSRLTLFTNRWFLFVLGGLLRRTEGKAVVAEDEARDLEHSADRMLESSLSLLEACERYRRSGPEGLDALTLESLPEVELHIALNTQRLLASYWDDLLAAPFAASQKDFNELSSALIRDAEQGLLPDSPSELLGHLSGRLSLDSHRHTFLRSALLPDRAEGLDGSASLNPFEFSIAKNDGTPLRSARGFAALKSLTEYDPDHDHNLLVVIRPSASPIGFTCSLASYRAGKLSPNRYVVVTWLHSCAVAAIAESLRKLADQLAGPENDVSWLISSPDMLRQGNCRPARLETLIADIGKSAAKVGGNGALGSEEVANWNFLQVRFPGYIVSADLEFGDELEMQFSITFQDTQWSGDQARNAILTLIGSTTEIKVGPEYVRTAILPALRQLRIEV